MVARGGVTVLPPDKSKRQVMGKAAKTGGRETAGRTETTGRATDKSEKRQEKTVMGDGKNNDGCRWQRQGERRWQGEQKASAQQWRQHSKSITSSNGDRRQQGRGRKRQRQGQQRRQQQRRLSIAGAWAEKTATRPAMARAVTATGDSGASDMRGEGIVR